MDDGGGLNFFENQMSNKLCYTKTGEEGIGVVKNVIFTLRIIRTTPLRKKIPPSSNISIYIQIFPDFLTEFIVPTTLNKLVKPYIAHFMHKYSRKNRDLGIRRKTLEFVLTSHSPTHVPTYGGIQ